MHARASAVRVRARLRLRVWVWAWVWGLGLGLGLGFGVWVRVWARVGVRVRVRVTCGGGAHVVCLPLHPAPFELDLAPKSVAKLELDCLGDWVGPDFELVEGRALRLQGPHRRRGGHV